MITASFVSEPIADTHPLALPVAMGQALDAVLSAALLPLANAAAARFDGSAGSLIEFLADQGGVVRRILLVGVGEDLSGEAAGSAVVARLLTSGETAVTFDVRTIADDRRADFAARLAQGATLRSWRHDAYRTRLPEKDRPTLTAVEIAVGDAQDAARQAWAPLQAAAEGVALARALVTEPGNIIYPESFVERCRELEALGVEITVLDDMEMRALGMGALLAVAQGSAHAPRLLAMQWDGTAGAAEPVALVGKGVTFDTGGISIKPAAGMDAMKWDMGGAAAIAGTMKTLALRKAKAHVIGVCGLVENMPDGKAMRPGDIVTTMSGQTVEVLNTDAEGRLVLADAVWWVQETYKARIIVDLATLTGAILVALGHEYAGLFTPDDTLADRLIAAGRAVDEKLWRMPMGPTFDKLIDSAIADMKNLGPPEAGSATAAQFIGRFVQEGVAWAHLDIAGMAWAAKPGTLCSEGATGFGVRLLDRYVRDSLE